MKIVKFSDLPLRKVFYYGGYSYTKIDSERAMSNRGHGSIEFGKDEEVNIAEGEDDN